MDGGSMFADELRRFAAEAARPPRIAVRGRRGTGRRTVAAALTAAGLPVTTTGPADLVVHLIAEVVKPEDADAVAGCRCPVTVVLNKADLAGGAELAAARLGTPVLPLCGLWAAAALTDRLDATLWDGLATLAAEPADTDCVEWLRAGAHRIPAGTRRRLGDVLDVSGIIRVLPAVRAGGTPDRVRALLRAASGIDALVGRLRILAAPLRYRRLLDAVLRLEALAVGDRRIADFLSRDATVLARAADAAAMLGDGGPVDALHRSAAAEAARGALRLWSVRR